MERRMCDCGSGCKRDKNEIIDIPVEDCVKIPTPEELRVGLENRKRDSLDSLQVKSILKKIIESMRNLKEGETLVVKWGSIIPLDIQTVVRNKLNVAGWDAVFNTTLSRESRYQNVLEPINKTEIVIGEIGISGRIGLGEFG